MHGWTGSSWLRKGSEWKRKKARGSHRWSRNNTDTMCHNVIRKAKAHLHLSLMWDEKGYYKHTSSKRKIRDNVGLLLNWGRDPVPRDTEKIKIMNTFFTSVFAGQTSLQEHQDSVIKRKVWKKENSPLVEEEPIESEYIQAHGTHKC